MAQRIDIARKMPLDLIAERKRAAAAKGIEHNDARARKASEFYKEGEDGSFSVRPLTPGAHYYGHLLSNGSVQAGDTFFVGVGIRSFDRSRANDVEVRSRSNFQWLIRSVEIRVVP